MALYFLNNGITFSSINKTQGFNPIVEVVIIAVLNWFLIETDNDEIFERISDFNEPDLNFTVFFKLIDQFSIPHQFSLTHGYSERYFRRQIYMSIIKTADQLTTMIGLSGFLTTDSPKFDKIPEPKRQELINLLNDTSKKIRILVKIEDGPESPPSPSVMSMIGSHDTKPWQVINAEAVENIRAKMALSASTRRWGGKRRKSSTQTQRRKKNMKSSKRIIKR